MSCSSKNNILQFDRAVPRYTSYPTAPHFKPITESNYVYPQLGGSKTLSLYIHIPFCKSMCWYCGCHTKVTKQYDPIQNYVDYLLKEIEMVANHQNHKQTVTHIHFGGGTPGILEPYDFERIMSVIQTSFDITPTAEIAIEIDPRGVTESRVQSYAKMGINRVSLGSQDFNTDVMKSVNREQPFELSHKAVELFRAHGIDNFNLDLIYGLPHQTVDKIQNNVNLALSLNPDRISLFGYAHVPWMKKHMRLIDEGSLPDKALRLDLFQAGADIMESRGYVPIGIDHFVKPTDSMATAMQQKILKRNFQGYTTDTSEIMVGLGVSSIGKTDDMYFQNHTEMPLYKQAIDNQCLPLAKSCNINENDKMRGQIIERLMCDFEIDLDNYQGDFSNALDQLKQYEDLNFITIQGSYLKIHRHARPLARIFCAAFDEYLPPENIQRHSKAI